MKKWYQTFEWSKITEPAFRWLAIGTVAILAPTAVTLSSDSDTTTTQTAIMPNTVTLDSLRECMKSTKQELQDLRTSLREAQINDSNRHVNIQQQITYTREDLADIKRILMSRAFASR